MNVFEFTKKVNMLLHYPVELGYTHPIEEFLEKFDINILVEYLLNYYFTQTNIENKKSIILAIGRLKCDKSKFENILFNAINHENLEIRDAAVHTAECCGSFGLKILEQSDEKCLWLARYIENVKEDLKKYL